jgi:hypothetical protein
MNRLRNAKIEKARREDAERRRNSNGNSSSSFLDMDLDRINREDPRAHSEGWMAVEIHGAPVYLKALTGYIDVNMRPVSVAQGSPGVIPFKFPPAPSFPNMGGAGKDYFALAVIMMNFETTNKGKKFKSEFIDSLILPVKGSDREADPEFTKRFKEFSSNLDVDAKSDLTKRLAGIEEVKATMPPKLSREKLKQYQNIFFMSHALPDFPWVQKAVKEIESWPSCYCWYCERDLTPGTDWLEGIYEGLDMCSWYVLFWSEKAINSKWTNEEIREAKTRSVQYSKPKISTANLGTSEWPKLLSRYQGALIKSDADLSKWLADIKVQVLGADTTMPPTTPPSTPPPTDDGGWK